MTKPEILDQQFIEARHKLLDVAAFLDRLARAPGDEDFRMPAFRRAMDELHANTGNAAERVLLAFSDPTIEPIAAAPGKGACGAWPGAPVSESPSES